MKYFVGNLWTDMGKNTLEYLCLQPVKLVSTKWVRNIA